MTENIFIVHYTKLKERKESILSYINKFNIPYNFIEACDQEELNLEALKNVYLPDKELFENKIKPLWDAEQHKFRVLNIAEISCTIKHLLAVKAVADTCKNHGLIFEDDSLPKRETFLREIEVLLQKVPQNWDAIFMGEGCGMSFIDSELNKHNIKAENGFCKANHPATNCAEAYLLKSAAAKKIYKESLPFQLVSDWELAHTFYKLNMNVYWAVPPIFTQGSKNGMFRSTLR